MKLHDLIFDKGFPNKYFRHILFWLSWWVFRSLQSLLFLTNMGVPQDQFARILSIKAFFISCEAVYTYLIVYYLMPIYRDRNKATGFTVAVILGICFHLITGLIAFQIRGSFDAPVEIRILDALNEFRNFLRTGSIIICLLFIACKMAKNYYLKLKEKNALIQENAVAELQLLKAQVSPHFLFNTLNNIYSAILIKRSQAPVLISKLYGTLQYMINDCEAALVPLDKELKMITDYTGLEKIRYGSRLKLNIVITGDPSEKMIAPLLLIPLIENCFKHGPSQMLQEPWVDMRIAVEESLLLFHLSNSKPVSGADTQDKNGIGLPNVRKRLALLYPRRHELVIDNSTDVFSVHVKIALHHVPYKLASEKEDKQKFPIPHNTPYYA